mmetsp:Transcript_137616/g.274531  ORF Transcript_137616/g.274531 Transcript_137616/m.274531 type:complete len:125 (-) Transcript_137616:171-545(-)
MAHYGSRSLATMMRKACAGGYSSSLCSRVFNRHESQGMHNRRLHKIGTVLQYAADICKQDKENVLAAVKQDGESFEHAADSLKTQELWLSRAAASNNSKQDKEIVLADVKQDGLALQNAADNFK